MFIHFDKTFNKIDEAKKKAPRWVLSPYRVRARPYLNKVK